MAFWKRKRTKGQDSRPGSSRSGGSEMGGVHPSGGGPGRAGPALSPSPGAATMTVFRVTVPDDVSPGEEFQVYAGTRIVRVRCPRDVQPGQYLQITVPAETNGNGNGNGNSSGSSSHSNSGRRRRQQPLQQQSQSQPPPQQPSQSQPQPPPQQQNSYASHDVRWIEDSDPPAYEVTVPLGVGPGDQFSVTIRGQELTVTCPASASPGMRVRIVPPPLPDVSDHGSGGGSGSYHRGTGAGGPMPPVQRRNSGSGHGNGNEYRNEYGNGSEGGDPGEGPRANGDGEPPLHHQQQRQRQRQLQPPPPPAPQESQLFEVPVPQGVQPGAPFALLADGVRVLVTCPNNAGPGELIRFRVPLALMQSQNNRRSAAQANEMQQIRLRYDKDGWTRTVRIDLKFQWIRIDDKGNIDSNLTRRFHMEKSAYVRRLRFYQGEDYRIRSGLLDLVPATDSVVDSKIRSTDGRELLSYGDLAKAQVKSFDEKTEWFQKTCAQLCVEWNEGHMRMNIRRQYLLGDSVDAVMSLSRKDLRKLWRFEFIGEMGIDAGGLAREWFELVCQEIFDPDMGLWVSSATNQMSMTINPASEYCCEDHLVYYRFLGRVMGKAMFDRQLVKGHMVKHLYKHILGWPIYFKDLESVDEEYYNNLKQLQSMHERGEDISVLCLDFTVTTEMMGVRKEVELVKDGASIDVTNDNFPEYVEACLKYKLMGSVKPQLNELLLGFFDVIPEPLLTIFDYQELELIMCGLPHIDLDDWKAHTEYSGEYEDLGIHHPRVRWFWETLEEFNDEMRARLLLFVTGTSGVPSRGFGVLQSNDGNIRNFTIHGVSAEICFYPRAHTCFNRIDLPLYDTKEELQGRLKLAVTMSATGFDIE